jgi:sulfite exporter TauE/SafE
MTLDLLLPVAFLAGFLGSGHCLGMCGPVIVLMESPGGQSSTFKGMRRRLIYNAGRMLFYILLGAVAGALGLVLTKITGINIGLAALRILAGLLVLALGFNLLFDIQMLRFLEKGGAVVWKRLSPLARHVLPISTPARALGAGFIWGALPCGLVYSSVAIAATSGNAASGALVMLVFGIGTLPALLVAGASASKLAAWIRHPILRRLTGLMLVGIGFFALAMPYLHGNSGGAHQHHAPESQTLDPDIH